MSFTTKIKKIGYYVSSKIRPFHYIYNSRVDFVDFWLILYILTSGIILFISQPLENIPVYTNLTNQGITSYELGAYALLVGTMNLVRLFTPFRLFCIYSTVFLKCLMLSFFFLMLFGILGNPVLPLTTGYLSVACLLSFDNIRRTW